MSLRHEVKKKPRKIHLKLDHDDLIGVFAAFQTNAIEYGSFSTFDDAICVRAHTSK